MSLGSSSDPPPILADDLLPGFLDPEVADWAPPPGRRGRHLPPPGRGGRTVATWSALAVDAAALGLSGSGATGAPRLLAGLAFLLAVPGWAVVGFLRLGWPAAEVSLTVATSLALVLLGAQVMLWAHVWQPLALQAVVGSLAAACLVAQLCRPPGART